MRLVVYEALSRSLTPFFNEKILCGLGREVHSSGLLAPDAVARALGALRRFRGLCRVMHVGRTYVVATAACREANNGPEFIAKAERILGTRIEILSGAREAKLSALGVVSAVYQPDGIVGDLGGGSLELVDIHGKRVGAGVSLPLGGLALQDMSHKSIKRADRIVRDELEGLSALKAGRGRTFYAVGGTWRALARLHISHTDYPLRVMHGYAIPADEALAFARRVKLMTPGRAHAGNRGCRRCAASAARLCGAGAGAHHPHREAEDDRDFHLWRARGAVVLEAVRARAGQGRADCRRARSQRAALAVAEARRGAVRLDQPLRQGRQYRRDAGRTPLAPRGLPASPISAGARIRTIAASSR